MTDRQSPLPTAERDSEPDVRQRVVLVTGMSGAGKSTALKAFEDMGFEAVDNVPLGLLSSLVQPRAADAAASSTIGRPLAIGTDIRTRDFGVAAFLAELDRLAGEPRLGATLVFLDSDDDVLARRYTETRHRHPLAADRPVADGIAHERRLMAPLRDRADVVLDTSALGPGDLKRLLTARFGAEAAHGLAVFVVSFAYRRGLPREADLVFDVRFLDNPHYDPALRPLTGRDEAVARRIAADQGLRPFMEAITGLLGTVLPRYAAEGKSYLTIAFGCTGGRHRSVYVAERLTEWLQGRGERVALSHRDLDRANG